MVTAMLVGRSQSIKKSVMTRVVLILTLALFLIDIKSSHSLEPVPKFTICSQNLFRYAENKIENKFETRQKQKSYLIQRFVEAKCDLIAVQELYGESYAEAKEVIEDLILELEENTNNEYSFFIGQSLDPYIRNAFIYKDDRFKIIEKKDYLNEHLERLNSRGPISRFLRAPVALRLHLADRPEQKFYIINYHLKSKAGGYKDPTRTNFEGMRMEMAEGIRNIIERETKNDNNTIFIALGDRNSDIEDAASEVLSGRRVLKDFINGNCQVNEELDAECESEKEKSPKLIGLFEYRKKNFLGKYLEGSYQFKGRQEFLDEIYVKEKDLDSFRGRDNNINIGVTGKFYKGSDHKLVWVRFEK